MEQDTVFKLIFMVFYVASVVIRYPHRRANQRNRIVQTRADGREKVLLGLATVGMAVIPPLYVFTPWFDALDYELPLAWRIVGAGLLFFPTLWLFYRAHRDLGRNWSATLEIREGHTLVRQGVYRLIRHPMYTAIWLWGLVLPLVLTNWLAGWSSLVSFGVLYLMRVRQEEQLMLTRFGAEYRQYMHETKRLIPYLF